MRRCGEHGAEKTLRTGQNSLIFRMLRRRLLACSGLLLWLPGIPFASAQLALPEAPSPRLSLIAAASPGADTALAPDPAAQRTFPPNGPRNAGPALPGLQPGYLPPPTRCTMRFCSQTRPARACCQRSTDGFSLYLSHNAVHIYTPKELAILAGRDVSDPFNLLTIGGTSLLSVASDPHSPYGPGFHGWARLSGVTLTQDLTGEFVGTFMIPALDHQDPHFHREPNASLMRRTLHCMVQPFWTVSDTGHLMPNYSTLIGTMIDEAVDVSYVPYQQVGWGPSAERIASSWATAPVGNFVTEFLPDVARHININVVFIQRIVNRVALEEGGGPSTP